MSEGAYTALVWAAIFVFMWLTARKVESAEGQRPRRDGLKLLVAAVLIAPAIFLFLTFGIGYISDHTPYIHGVNLTAAAVAVLGTYGLFVIGSVLSRRSKGQCYSHVFGDAAILFAAALAAVAVMLTAIVALQQR